MFEFYVHLPHSPFAVHRLIQIVSCIFILLFLRLLPHLGTLCGFFSTGWIKKRNSDHHLYVHYNWFPYRDIFHSTKYKYSIKRQQQTLCVSFSSTNDFIFSFAFVATLFQRRLFSPLLFFRLFFFFSLFSFVQSHIRICGWLAGWFVRYICKLPPLLCATLNNT